MSYRCFAIVASKCKLLLLSQFFCTNEKGIKLILSSFLRKRSELPSNLVIYVALKNNKSESAFVQ